jgi:hypothetical protein
MPNPAPVSRWSGRVQRTLVSTAIFMLLTGCAHHLTRSYAVDDVDFMRRAVEGSGPTREAMWKETQAAERTQNNQLRIAILQSVPDHSGADTAAAQRSLRNLLAQNPPPEIAAVARLRLSELRSSDQCSVEAQELRRRLAQVVNIERRFDAQGH